jgi:predicted double-glycine peptidase
MKILNLPDLIQSTDYDCGVICTQAILAYYGQDSTEFGLLDLFDIDSESGMQEDEIINFFKDNDFNVKAGKLTKEDLIDYIDKDIPIILLLQAYKDDEEDYKETDEYGHYVICIGYDDENIIFEDPAVFGRTILSFKELEDRWHCEGEKKELEHYGIVITGKEIFDFDEEFIHMEKLNNMESETLGICRCNGCGKERGLNPMADCPYCGEPGYNVEKISLKKTADDGPAELVNLDDTEQPTEEGNGDMDEMFGGSEPIGGGGDMDGADGLGEDEPGGPGGMEQPQAPTVDYDNIFIERTDDLKKIRDNDEDFAIDFSRLV